MIVWRVIWSTRFVFLLPPLLQIQQWVISLNCLRHNLYLLPVLNLLKTHHFFTTWHTTMHELRDNGIHCATLTLLPNDVLLLYTLLQHGESLIWEFLGASDPTTWALVDIFEIYMKAWLKILNGDWGSLPAATLALWCGWGSLSHKILITLLLAKLLEHFLFGLMIVWVMLATSCQRKLCLCNSTNHDLSKTNLRYKLLRTWFTNFNAVSSIKLNWLRLSSRTLAVAACGLDRFSKTHLISLLRRYRLVLVSNWLSVSFILVNNGWGLRVLF